MLSKFLDPKNDFAFRRIFGTERNKDILIHFINDILTFKEGSPITDVTFLKTIQDPEIATKKTSIVDVLCRDKHNNQYIVEMQVAKERGFEKRAQYYAAKAYANQADVGGEYENLKEIVFIAITDFIMFPNKTCYQSDHVILDKSSLEHDLKDFTFTFLELPKFNIPHDQLKTMTDKWMYFFKKCDETSEKDLAHIIGSDLIIERAYHELDRFYWNEIELRTYEQSQKYEHTYHASMRQKYDEGIEKGKEEGREEGERFAKLEMARNLKSLGVSADLITKATGLTEAEID